MLCSVCEKAEDSCPLSEELAEPFKNIAEKTKLESTLWSNPAKRPFKTHSKPFQANSCPVKVAIKVLPC